MPTRYTPEQLAASAVAGEPRLEESFEGDTAAWHAYQDDFVAKLMLGKTLPPVGDADRAKLWKAARRQRGKIELQRAKDEADAVSVGTFVPVARGACCTTRRPPSRT